MSTSRAAIHIMDAIARDRKKKPASSKSSSRPESGVQTLSRQVADAAVECVEAYMTSEREDIIQSSVDYLCAMSDIWVVRKINTRDIWREIDGRIQVSMLLNRLNQQRATSPRVKRKPWRPTSTKLP